MDINAYSYAPHMLDDQPPHYTPCNRVTIERRTANSRDYYVISTDNGSNKAYDLRTAIKTAIDWMEKGV